MLSIGKLIAVGVCVLGTTTGVSYVVTSKSAHGAKRVAAAAQQVDPATVFPSGKHLIVYALLASDCGMCTEAKLKAAMARMRDSLVTTNRGQFAAIRVIGVALDEEVPDGVRYLASFRGTFDQIVVGGSWLNEVMSSMAWRDHIATTQIPQLLAFQRSVDATGYPQTILVQPDSLLLRVIGRDSVIAWVNRGARVKMGK